jgi:hypothetical protein
VGLGQGLHRENRRNKKKIVIIKEENQNMRREISWALR